MQGAALAARKVVITAANDGPEANISSWFLMVCVVLAVVTRLAIQKFNRGARFNSQDHALVLATLLYLAHMALTVRAVDAGLGRDKHTLAQGEVDTLGKLLFAMDMLYFPILLLSKYACLELLRRLGCLDPLYRVSCIFGMVFTFCWAIVGCLVIGFQCGGTPVWSGTPAHCVDMLAFWKAMLPSSLVTEVLILLLPIWLTWDLQLTAGRKAVVMMAFALRIVVVVTDITRVSYWSNDYVQLEGHLLVGGSTKGQILLQLVIACAIMTACTPVLKPFLDAFDSGLLGVCMNDSFDLTQITQRVPARTPSEDRLTQNRRNRRMAAREVAALNTMQLNNDPPAVTRDIKIKDFAQRPPPTPTSPATESPTTPHSHKKLPFSRMAQREDVEHD